MAACYRRRMNKLLVGVLVSLMLVACGDDAGSGGGGAGAGGRAGAGGAGASGGGGAGASGAGAGAGGAGAGTGGAGAGGAGTGGAGTGGAGAGGAAGSGMAPSPLSFAAEVSQAQLTTSIADLVAFRSRYTYGTGDEAARDYLVGRLAAYGLTAELDPFTVGTDTAENVIAKKPGTTEPGVVFIFSAHYDSTSGSPMTDAPGADDNASGVAAVLEAARVLAPHSFRYSLWFVFTAAEEQGSKGSAHLAQTLMANHVDVRGVIAPDMIAYWPLGDRDSFDILGDPASTALVDRMAGIADQLGVAHKKWIRHDYCEGDDHTMFQNAGFPAITPMDCVEAHNIPSSGENTPHYHMPEDRPETLHMPFTTKVASVIVATFADLGVPL